MDTGWDFSDLYYGIDMSGKFLLREEYQMLDDKQNERKLIDRYKFLYNNSYVILGLILDGVSGFLFYEEITKKTNIKLQDIDIALYDKDESLNIGEVLEEFLLGDKDIDKTVLYRYVESIWSSSPRMRNSKKKGIITENIGFSEYDKAVKFILDFVYSFVSAQQERKTYIYEEKDGTYKPSNSIVHGCKTIYEIEIKEKLDVLDRYYDIISFTNKKDDKLTFDKGIMSQIPEVEKSLVSYNTFIRTFASDYRTRGSSWENPRYLSLAQKRDLYFYFHDEIPFDYGYRCESDECQSSFNVLEEDVFYLDDLFKTICPCCGKVNSISLPNVKRIDKVRKRIVKRSLNDDLLEDKIKLLSELTAIGGIELAKEKVKRK